MKTPFGNKDEFIITIEVVPPPDHDPSKLLDNLSGLSKFNPYAFSVASNPVAKPRMSAMAFSSLIQESIKQKAMLHITVRDQNRLGLQSELWGARALGIDTVIVVTGDPSARTSGHPASTVGDVSVFELIEMAQKSGLNTGAVLDFRPEVDGLDHEVVRLEKKVAAGCRFIVTQPVYDESTAARIAEATKELGVPVIMGILPLISPRHAVFLHDKVAGISVPQALRKEMADSKDPVNTGIVQSRQMLALARQYFSGACVMPPFDRFEILAKIL